MLQAGTSLGLLQPRLAIPKQTHMQSSTFHQIALSLAFGCLSEALAKGAATHLLCRCPADPHGMSAPQLAATPVPLRPPTNSALRLRPDHLTPSFPCAMRPRARPAPQLAASPVPHAFQPAFTAARSGLLRALAAADGRGAFTGTPAGELLDRWGRVLRRQAIKLQHQHRTQIDHLMQTLPSCQDLGPAPRPATQPAAGGAVGVAGGGTISGSWQHANRRAENGSAGQPGLRVPSLNNPCCPYNSAAKCFAALPLFLHPAPRTLFA